jgi:hypothetical protein
VVEVIEMASSAINGIIAYAYGWTRGAPYFKMPDLISHNNALIRLRCSLFSTASFMPRHKGGHRYCCRWTTLALLGNDLEGKAYTTVGDQVRAKEVAKIFYVSLTLCWGDDRTGTRSTTPQAKRRVRLMHTPSFF